jgi:hypothetical protein
MTRISLAGRFFTAILLAALLAFAPIALTDRALASGGAQKRHANPLGVPHHSLFFFGSLVVKGMLTLSVITGKRG